MATSELNLKITMHADDAATVRVLGALPYMLVEVGKGEDGDFELTIETGGGVPQEDEAIVNLLTVVLEGLTEGEDIEATPTAKGSA